MNPFEGNNVVERANRYKLSRLNVNIIIKITKGNDSFTYFHTNNVMNIIVCFLLNK